MAERASTYEVYTADKFTWFVLRRDANGHVLPYVQACAKSHEGRREAEALAARLNAEVTR